MRVFHLRTFPSVLCGTRCVPYTAGTWRHRSGSGKGNAGCGGRYCRRRVVSVGMWVLRGSVDKVRFAGGSICLLPPSPARIKNLSLFFSLSLSLFTYVCLFVCVCLIVTPTDSQTEIQTDRHKNKKHYHTQYGHTRIPSYKDRKKEK